MGSSFSQQYAPIATEASGTINAPDFSAAMLALPQALSHYFRQSSALTDAKNCIDP
jgi:hypothetical protein